LLAFFLVLGKYGITNDVASLAADTVSMLVMGTKKLVNEERCLALEASHKHGKLYPLDFVQSTTQGCIHKCIDCAYRVDSDFCRIFTNKDSVQKGCEQLVEKKIFKKDGTCYLLPI
jgi:hypothetical protein